MIVIQEIIFYEVEGPVTKLMQANHDIKCTESAVADIKIQEQIIRGKIFCRPSDNTRICIGTSKQAQELIGIQFEAWGEKERFIAKQKEIIRTLNAKVTILKSLTAWDHFKRGFRKLFKPDQPKP